MLWEKPTGNNTMHGLTDNYIRVEAPYKSEYINKVTEVVIKAVKPENSELAIAEHINDPVNG